MPKILISKAFSFLYLIWSLPLTNGTTYQVNSMVIQFFEIAENNIKEFKSQLKIAYKNHFKNTKSFKEAFKDFSDW